MTGSESVREKVVWIGAVALGAWLSVGLARWMAESLAALRTGGAAGGPVREVVAEVLSEHKNEDTPIVQAFEEALEEEGAEESRV